MNPTHETMEAIKGIHQNPLSEEISKAITSQAGLVAYDLEPAAKLLAPVNTPLRNILPRVAGRGGNATNWKAIVGLNSDNISAGVKEGQRGGVVSTTIKDFTAAYKGIGLEDFVTFEADYGAAGFDDARAIAVDSLLKSVFISEERLIVGGNGGAVQLGKTNKPTAGVATGGEITAGTYNVICVALTSEGYRRASLARGLIQKSTRVNADGTTDTVNCGVAKKSDADTATTTATNNAITASVQSVAGAVAYAWYVGATGSEYLQAITTVSGVKLTKLFTSGQKASELTDEDTSVDSLAFDGLLSLAFAEGSGAQIVTLSAGNDFLGSKLVSDGAGGVNEVDNVLLKFWDNLKLSPTDLLCSARTAKCLTSKIVKNSNGDAANPLVQIIHDASGVNADQVASTRITKYLNKITGQLINIIIHPDIADGTILFFTRSVPYPLSGVSNLIQVKTRREYYQIEWPVRTRRYEYGVYCDELLQHYFPPSLGVLRNININA